ncbi:MAG TPA: hypothetical protein VL614_25620 [Acetobacteraceae bacterium]|nr:hypothetical protein [Acetobacteraceae bacterium]
MNGQTVEILMAGGPADMVSTDPPYNVPIDGHVSGLGALHHRDFAMASGELTREQFVGFLEAAFRNLTAYSADGAIHFVCMDWQHMNEVLQAGSTAYSELKNLKDNGGMGTFYRSRHELIFAYKYGAAPHINSFELGQHRRYRTNVWQYRGVNTRKVAFIEGIRPASASGRRKVAKPRSPTPMSCRLSASATPQGAIT